MLVYELNNNMNLWYTPAERNPFTGDWTMRIILPMPMSQSEVIDLKEVDTHQTKVADLRMKIEDEVTTTEIAKTPENQEMTIGGLVMMTEEEKEIKCRLAKMRETKAIGMIGGIEIGREIEAGTGEGTEIEIGIDVTQRRVVPRIDTGMRDLAITRKEIAQDHDRGQEIRINPITDR